MSIYRLRKNKALKSGIMCALTVFVPLVTVVIVLIVINISISKRAAVYKNELELINNSQTYALACDIQAGQVIESNMIKLVNIYSDAGINIVTREEIIGMRAVVDMSQDTIIDNCFLYEGEELSDDSRIGNYTFIDLYEGAAEGDMIDIRVEYPDGENYIVAEHKEITSIAVSEDYLEAAEISFIVSEEEILKMSSAYVDTLMYTGTRVYAVRYAGNFQTPAYPTYPVNLSVLRQMNWDPNICTEIDTSDNEQKRQTLDSNLSQYKNVDFIFDEASIVTEEESQEIKFYD